MRGKKTPRSLKAFSRLAEPGQQRRLVKEIGDAPEKTTQMATMTFHDGRQTLSSRSPRAPTRTKFRIDGGTASAKA